MIAYVMLSYCGHILTSLTIALLCYDLEIETRSERRMLWWFSHFCLKCTYKIRVDLKIILNEGVGFRGGPSQSWLEGPKNFFKKIQ